MSASSTNAQDGFSFQNQLRDTIHITLEDASISKHFLGNELAVKYYRLQETYTYVEPGSVTNPAERTIVTKATIYNSIKKITSHYKKQVKKGEIDSADAVEELGYCYDVAFSIYEQDTSDFEKALKSAKKPDEMAMVFAEVVLK